MNAVLDHPIQHDGLGRLRDKHLFVNWAMSMDAGLRDKRPKPSLFSILQRVSGLPVWQVLAKLRRRSRSMRQ